MSKFSWFPSLLSWRRRNFLGKRFTFLAARELLVKSKPGSSLCPSAPFCIQLLTNNLGLVGQSWGGGVWSCRLSTFGRTESCTVNGDALNAYAEFLPKRREVCFPLFGPQIGRKARFLCGWIQGSRLVTRSNFLSQQVRRGNGALTQGGSCQNKHIWDIVSHLIFTLELALLISHLSHAGISWAVCASSNTQTIIADTKQWRGWMRAHDGPFENTKHCHNGSQEMPSYSSRVWGCKQAQVAVVGEMERRSIASVIRETAVSELQFTKWFKMKR